MHKKISKKSSLTPSVQPKNSQFAARPFVIQAQQNSQNSSNQAETKNQNELEEIEIQRKESHLGWDLATVLPSTPQPERVVIRPKLNRKIDSNIDIPIQPQLNIGPANDKYEREADQVASQVVQKINRSNFAQAAQKKSLQRQEAAAEEIQTKPIISKLQRSPVFSLQREAIPEDDEELQAKSILQRQEAIGGGKASTELEAKINSAKGSGQPLDADLQRSMGEAIGADFSGVKVHTDANSNQLNQSIQAKAFTTGQDIFFAQRQYNPGSKDGQELIAHELTHVVQQGGAVLPGKIQTKRNLQLSGISITNSHPRVIQRVLWSPEEYKEKVIAPASKMSNNTTIKQIKKRLIQYYQLPNLTIENKLPFLREFKQLTEEAVQYLERENRPKDKENLNKFLVAIEAEINDLQALNQQKATKGGTSEIDAYINYQYQRIFAEIHGKVCYKLGLERGEWRRSAKLNNFRNTLKQAARSQAYQDIDSQITAALQNANKATSAGIKDYYAMRAKGEAYTEAKGSVNQVIQELAAEITNHHVNDQTIAALKTAAQGARTGKAKEAVKSKADEIIKTKAGTTKGANASVAMVEARKIAKGTAQEDIDARAALETGVKQKTESNQVGQKSIQKVIEADTLEKGFARIASLVDWAVPQPGTDCSLDVQVKVPIPGAAGVYFTTQVVGSAEKDEEEGNPNININVEVTLGAGWSALGIIDISFQAGLFFDATASTSQKALQLVSYGFYRKFQTENLDSTVANKVWGMNKKQAESMGMTQAETAETWAAGMEEWLFTTNGQKNDAAVEVGFVEKANAKINAGIGTVEAGLKSTQGTTFSANTLGTGLGKANKTQPEIHNAVYGLHKNTYSLSAELEALQGLLGGGAEAKLVRASMSVGKQVTSRYTSAIELEIFGKLNTSWAGDTGRAVQIIAGTIASGGNILNTLIKQTQQREKGLAGSLTSVGTDIGYISQNASTSLGQQVINQTGEVTDDLTGESSTAGQVNQSLKLGFKLAWEKEKSIDPFEFSCEAYLSRIRELSYDAGFVSLKGESGSKIARFKYKGSSFSGNFLGIKSGS